MLAVKARTRSRKRLRDHFQIAVLSDGGHGGSGGGGGSNSTTSWDKIKLCGADFCVLGNGGHENLERPPESEIYEISAIYLACVVIAVIIVALFVDPLSRWVPNIPKRKLSEIRGMLIARERRVFIACQVSTDLMIVVTSRDEIARSMNKDELHEQLLKNVRE